MSCCWTDEKLCKLLQLYSKYSNLWDRSHPCHDNLRGRYNSYKKILASLSMPAHVSVSDVLCKLKDLRAVYVCELHKIEAASKAGSIYRPRYTWFEPMNEFLYCHLDADEKLAEFSSSEDDATSSEETVNVCEKRDCCEKSDSVTESNSDGSICPGKHKSGGKRKSSSSVKPGRKSKAYFLRSPTMLRSTRMNTKYEIPRKTGGASSLSAKNSSSVSKGMTCCDNAEDTQQCTELDVNMTSSDVLIKYRRTENVNGDEKLYKKNFKGPRRSSGKSPCFKNIKMVISRSGYSGVGSTSGCCDIKDEDTELWDMMSMLDLELPCPSVKLPTSSSPKSSSSTTTSSSSESLKSGRSHCCKDLDAGKDLRERNDDDLSTPCRKTPKVVCLGDGTVFDENVLELLEDLSVKICPIDVGCRGGTCSTAPKHDDYSQDSAPCGTCSTITRPIKMYDPDEAEAPSKKEEPAREKKNGDDEQESFGKSESALEENVEEEMNPVPKNLVMNYNLKVELANGRSSSGRESFIHEAKKELWEAEKLYNSGKFVTRGIIDSDSKDEESAEFDKFGAEVASSLKNMGKHRALKLKQAIAETMRMDEKRRKFF